MQGAEVFLLGDGEFAKSVLEILLGAGEGVDDVGLDQGSLA